jgi:hypothetical protein
MQDHTEAMTAAASGHTLGVAAKAGRTMHAVLPARYEISAPQMLVAANDSYIQNPASGAAGAEGSETAGHD